MHTLSSRNNTPPSILVPHNRPHSCFCALGVFKFIGKHYRFSLFCHPPQCVCQTFTVSFRFANRSVLLRVPREALEQQDKCSSKTQESPKIRRSDAAITKASNRRLFIVQCVSGKTRHQTYLGRRKGTRPRREDSSPFPLSAPKEEKEASE